MWGSSLANVEEVQQPEDKQAETFEGGLYEIVVTIKSKYDAKHIQRVIALLKTGEGLVDMQPFHKMSGYWIIEDVVAESDAWNNFVPIVNNGPSEEWRLRIRARKLGGTPVVVAVGVILALLIILVGVVGWQAYRIKDVAVGTFFNPVFIVGAALIVAIIWGGKRVT